MTGLPTITMIGTVVGDPELRFTPSGAAVANFTVAANERRKDEAGNWVDGDATFLRCNIWRQPAENASETLRKGHRVVVTGQLKQRSYEKDGQKRTAYELEVDEVAVSLKWATAVVTKSASGSNQSAGRTSNSGARSTQHDAVWDTPKDDSDTPPF